MRSGLADDSNPGAAGMNPDSRRDSPPENPVRHEIRHQLTACVQSVNRVILPAETLSPQCHHSITSEVVYHPVIPVNRSIHQFIEAIEDRPEVTGRHFLCERRRASDVGEQKRHGNLGTSASFVYSVETVVAELPIQWPRPEPA